MSILANNGNRSCVGKKHSTVRRRTLMGMTSALAMLVSTSVIAAGSANGAEQEITLEKAPLNIAIVTLSKQTGIHIFAPTDLVGGKMAAPINGMMTPEQALMALLAGTNLAYQRGPDGTYIIQEKADPASAPTQANNNGDSSFILEEIIVTATRRETGMQDIPMSINAFSGERIKEGGVQNLVDLQQMAAGVHVAKIIGTTRVAIRGIGSNLDSAGAESGAAVYRDGVYLAQRTDLGMGFFDVERIEVLRGPQGTLYGRNATGGAISIISGRPTSEFEAGGELTYGNYDLFRTEGYVSGPLLGDKVLARFAFGTGDNDGYTPNIYDGRTYNNEDYAGARASFTFLPTDRLTIDVKADAARDDGVTLLTVARGRANLPIGFEELGGILPEGRAINQNSTNASDKEAWGLSGQIEQAFDTATLRSVTAYRKVTTSSAFDLDGGDADILATINTAGFRQFSQEITLASTGDSDLNWLLGGYYFNGRETGTSEVPIPVLGFTIFGEIAGIKTDAYSGFAEINYMAVENLTLTVGGRFSYEKKSIDQSSSTAGSETLEDSWNNFSPSASLHYDISDDISAYTTFSKGFKAGGFNAAVFQGRAYEPEKVTNYEFGLKTSLLDGRLQANLSAFYMDYSNLQVLVRRLGPGGTTINAVDNAASAIIKGIEFDFVARPTDRLKLDGNLAYLDATFDEYLANDRHRGNEAFDVSGNQIPNAPEFSFNLGVTYDQPIGDWGIARLHGDYAYSGRIFFSPFGFDSPLESQKAYSLVNASIALEPNDSVWRIKAWVKNLTDELVAGRVAEVPPGGLTGPLQSIAYQTPRTYGVTVSFTF